MQMRHRECRRLARGALLVAIAILLLPCSALARQSSAKPGGSLARALATLAKPSVASRTASQQATIVGLPVAGPGSLLRRGNRVVVRVDFDHGTIASRAPIEEAGAQVLNDSRRYQLATVAVPPADLNSLAAIPTVTAVTPERTPRLYAAGCEGGSVISEGVQQLLVDEAREVFPLRGKGITVGVLSDSFDRAAETIGGGPIATHAKQDIVSNDIPGPAGTCSDQQIPVRVLEDGPAGESHDEGRAMLQIVHDLAPHASLAFATAFEGELGFAQNIERLAKPVSEGGAGADVIVDDVGYFEEPFFQDGPVAAAVNKVTSVGVTYLSAAGNDNLFDEEEHEIGSWEAPEFRDAGSCPTPLGPTEITCMDFDPGAGTDTTFGITVEPRATLNLDLQWAEPWFGVETDLDAFLFNKTGTQVLAESAENNIGGVPFELITWENEKTSPQEVRLAINRCIAACNPAASLTSKPRLKFTLLENGGGVEEIEYPVTSGGDVVGPTIYGHAGAASAITVAATRFNSGVEPEGYSSRGPVTHYFEEVDGPTPASPIAGGEVISKPDVTATDCGATTFFAFQSGGVWRFCGTSAAAPHAAAVAALLRQGDANASSQQVREILEETATPMPPFSAAAVGAGLVDARSAVEALPELTAAEDGPSTIVPPLEEEEEVQPRPPITNPPPPPPPPPPAAPDTSFAAHPKKTVRIRGRRVRLTFRFLSDQSGVIFLCKVDSGFFHACGPKLTRPYASGKHVVKVKARNSAGLTDPTPAVFRFKVERIF